MSPKKKTWIIRQNKKHPNAANLKKRERAIKQVQETLRALEQEG